MHGSQPRCRRGGEIAKRGRGGGGGLGLQPGGRPSVSGPVARTGGLELGPVAAVAAFRAVAGLHGSSTGLQRRDCGSGLFPSPSFVQISPILSLAGPVGPISHWMACCCCCIASHCNLFGSAYYGAFGRDVCWMLDAAAGCWLLLLRNENAA